MASSSFLNLILFFHFALVVIPNPSHGHITHEKNHAPLFIFGDSLFDAGNNNYINTTTLFQANFSPYGETFFKHPTGRFSDGRTIPDFIAEYAKLPLLPPYRQPGNHQFTYGANFASAGAGALAQTYQGMVIDLKTQLIDFKKMEKLLEEQLGGREAKQLVSKAVYLFGIGSNDYITPFFVNSSTVFQTYSPHEYVDTVIGNLTTVVKEIYRSGGRKFGFVSLGPVECLPIVKAVYSPKTGDCLDELAALRKLHNIALSKLLKRLETQLYGFKYSIIDFYTAAIQRMDNPSKYGFKEGESACCGSGPFRGFDSCGEPRGLGEYELCSNASEYVFFDSSHPTERVSQQYAQLMWSGPQDVVWPYNLKALFGQTHF